MVKKRKKPLRPQPPKDRELTYLDVGHPTTRTEAKRSGVVAFWMRRDEDDIVYGKVGESHGATVWGDFRYSDIMGRVVKKRKIISVATVSAPQERIDYAVKILAMDWPGYEIWFFNEGGERKSGTRLKNPARLHNPTDPLFDTSNPPPDPDRALGYAGVYNERRKAIRAWHVTNDAKQTIELIESGIPLLEMGGEHRDLRELGPGLYMSAVPQLWIGRATKKWEFLEHLNPMQRQVLADALGEIVLGQRQTGYITEGEYEMANKDLGYFAEKGSVGHVLQLAGQPFNIGFWKPDFLKPLGIKPGPEPEVVEFLVQGIFAGFDNQPQTRDIKDTIKGGLSGCFLRGGLVNIAQMVVWRDDAIVGMKRVKL